MITARRLGSGYWHIQGDGPCQWSQPPQWPCGESMLREYAFGQASDAFIREAVAYAQLQRAMTK